MAGGGSALYDLEDNIFRACSLAPLLPAALLYYPEKAGSIVLRT